MRMESKRFTTKKTNKQLNRKEDNNRRNRGTKKIRHAAGIKIVAE